MKKIIDKLIAPILSVLLVAFIAPADQRISLVIAAFVGIIIFSIINSRSRHKISNFTLERTTKKQMRNGMLLLAVFFLLMTSYLANKGRYTDIIPVAILLLLVGAGIVHNYHAGKMASKGK